MSSTAISVNSNSNTATINISPFRLTFYQNEVLSVTFNAQNLMRFEHYRTKPVIPDPFEEPGTWEESFNGFSDSKPNG